MSEHLDIGAFFDDSHSKSAQMADLALFDKGDTGAEDSFMEMLGSGECMFECFDAVFHIRIM